MATSARLSLNFTKSSGELMNITYSNVKQNVSSANVKALMQGIIANGDIFSNRPVAIISAEIITTDKTVVDLS